MPNLKSIFWRRFYLFKRDVRQKCSFIKSRCDSPCRAAPRLEFSSCWRSLLLLLLPLPAFTTSPPTLSHLLLVLANRLMQFISIIYQRLPLIAAHALLPLFCLSLNPLTPCFCFFLTVYLFFSALRFSHWHRVSFIGFNFALAVVVVVVFAFFN